jgi:hypothetical protein
VTAVTAPARYAREEGSPTAAAPGTYRFSRLPEVINFEPMGMEGMMAAKAYLKGKGTLDAPPLQPDQIS